MGQEKISGKQIVVSAASSAIVSGTIQFSSSKLNKRTQNESESKIIEESRSGDISVEDKARNDIEDISLGKGRYLFDFSDEIDARSYREWHTKGLVKDPIEEYKFARPFYQASMKTDRIRFNLEDVKIDKAITMTKSLVRNRDPILHQEIGHLDLITEWELAQILRNRKLFNKTTFHYGSAVEFTSDEAAMMGLKYLGNR